MKQVKLWFISKCIHNSSGNSTIIQAPSKPRNRPASPITFASAQRHRSISPIQFASGSARPPALNAKASFGSSDDDAGAGYEEDDELDGAPSNAKTLPQKPQHHRRHSLITKKLNNRPPEATKSAPVQKGTQKHSILGTYDPDKLALIRFSTGQVLEDDFPLEWYGEYSV